MLEQVGMGAHARKMPEGLSGGQQQRIAFGRAMVLRPRLLLLDEPFASLDPHTRQQMQELFLHLREAHRTAAIFVTHDLKEALLLGQRIGRMEAGNLRLYPSAEDFARDPESGVAGELGFWARFLP
jgi:putrescine transport system ATP-binding protein